MTKINIVAVSLFDGLSGGRIALERTPHLNVLRYYSSEVDEYAIQVADKNYPQDTPYRLGDITKIDFYKLFCEIKEEFPEAKIMIIGGSPCQGFSMAGKLKGSSTACGVDVDSLRLYMILKKRGFEFNGQSYLFWEYVRALRTIKPDYFMLENVRVTKKWLPMFNEAMGVEPTRINSSLVSAGLRDRYYWHNFGEIPQPEDRKIILNDILWDGFTDQEKSYCIDASYWKGGNLKQYFEKHRRQLVFSKDGLCHIGDAELRGHDSIKRVYHPRGKCPTITTCTGGHRESKILYKDGWRKLIPLECARVQTIPDSFIIIWFDEKGKQVVSNSQLYKMIGNGWTIDVPAHIFSFIR